MQIALSTFLLLIAVTYSNSWTLNCPGGCQGTAPKCISQVPAPFESVPPNTLVAFIADQGLGNNSLAVLRLIQQEGANMVIHSGGFDYSNNATAWDNQITSVLGSSFPYFSSVGSPDVAQWTSYQQAIYNRLQRINGSNCIGEVGVNAICTYRGLTFVLSGVGYEGDNGTHPLFVLQGFSTFPGQWRFCSFYGNQRLMQVGSQTDQVGWAPYEACRLAGAVTVTGHDRSYARSLVLSVTQNQTLTSGTTAANPVISEGNSLVVVSGVGGEGIDNFTDSLNSNAWWASANSASNGLNYGAWFCKINGKTANCYFKQIDGTVLDSFTLTSNVSTEHNFDPQFFRQSQVANGSDDIQGTDCNETSLPLGIDAGSKKQAIALRFPNVELKPSDNVTQAAILFYCSGNSTDQTDLTITGELVNNSASLCGTKTNKRVRTISSVSWSNVTQCTDGDQIMTADISSIIQEIISGTGWHSGDYMTFFISGTGNRPVVSYEGSACAAPILAIEISNTTSTTST